MVESCASVNGCASGSDFAAKRMIASSSGVGILIISRLDVFDIVFHLTAFCPTQANGSADLAAIIQPNEGGIPIEFLCQR